MKLIISKPKLYINRQEIIERENMKNILENENDNTIDYRTDHIARLFQKMSNKRLESYVVSRIWHKLDDEDIKIVPQQFVKNENGKYALTDLFLPQFNLHIEVNEPAHYFSQEKEYKDAIRKREIERNSQHKVIEIDCRGKLADINSQVDLLVTVIKNAKEIQINEKKFKAWETESQFTVDFHEKRGFLNIEDNPSLRTVDQICSLFKAKVPKNGFLRKGGVIHPENSDLLIWWPSAKNNNFDNVINNEENIIIERSIKEEKRNSHYDGLINKNINRLTFFKDKDFLNFTFYRFKGIYAIDKEASSPEKGITWKRIETTFTL